MIGRNGEDRMFPGNDVLGTRQGGKFMSLNVQLEVIDVLTYQAFIQADALNTNIAIQQDRASFTPMPLT